MDELSGFDFAPPELTMLESKLLSKSDLVFTGGVSLFEAKKAQHHNIYAFPSSIDHEHFAKAKDILWEPDDQKDITGPKIGFFGVIDERFDVALIKEVAEKRPNWQIILIGPTVKINPEILPQRDNIHYLGPKKYEELPNYLSGWDVALIPFALNKSTRFISPTKTPEYLAAGIPVVSTPIRDVVCPYGEQGLVRIGKTPSDFIHHISEELFNTDKTTWELKVGEFLKDCSWDNTFGMMQKLIAETHSNRIQLAS